MADIEGQPAVQCLIVDDDEDDVRLIESYLHDIAEFAVSVRWESGFDAALAALRHGSHTVCFVDYRIGEPNGITFIKTAARTGTPVPLILMTGSADPAVDAEAAAAGAVDFIAKDDLSARTLASTIRFAMANLEKTDALRRHQRELEETMAALAEQKALLQLAIDHTKHGIAMFDSDRHLMACNARYMEIYGFSADVVTPGTDIDSILYYSISLGNYTDDEAERILAERLLQVASPRPSIYQQRLRNGRTITVSHEPIAGGRSVTTCEDVTESLERQHRSAALARSAALSDAAVTAKAKFLSNMSHELRTPLNAIIGFNDAMCQELFGPLGSDQYRSYAGHVADSAAMLLRVIDQVLDMSLLYGEELGLDEAEFALAETIELTVQKYRAASAHKQIALRFATGAPTVRLRGDGAKIAQAVDNIVDNALKFCLPHGAIVVSLQRGGDGDVVITVSDTGTGIPADRIEALLAPFEQAEAADARNQHGTGLGLPIALGLIRLHGGDIAIDSAVDTGTTVKITLPAERVVAHKPAAKSRTAA